MAKKHLQSKPFTTGVHMTVWQTIPEDDYGIQQLFQNQEEIRQLKARHEILEARLAELEQKVENIQTTERMYNSMLQTLKLILKK